MNKDTTAAFPCSTGFDGGAFQTGMTLRDWFAGQALIGLSQALYESEPGWVAAKAAKLADAMIEELEK